MRLDLRHHRGRGPRAPRALGLPMLAVLLVLGCATPSVWTNDADEPWLVPNIFADIAEKTLPSVVAIKAESKMSEELERMRRNLFGEEGQEGDEEEGRDPHEGVDPDVAGSGVVISEKGYIITSNHIVSAAKEGKITVVLNDDTVIEPDKVQVIAVDDFSDLAILKIDPGKHDLKPIPWGNSDSLRIGDWVLAIGNPLELRGSVSKGIVSAKQRKIGKVAIERLIQTDAMINPGNSGGALVNLKGELVGINMAIATNSGFFQGIGFAIPSNDARFIADQVIEHGKIRRGYIGIWMHPLEDENVARWMGLEKGTTGIVVTDVSEGTPAANAGVEAYDVIVAVDNIDIDDTQDLLGLIASKHVGDSAQLTILREEKGKIKEKHLTMDVSERPPDNQLPTRSVRQRRIVMEAEVTVGDVGLEFFPPRAEDDEGLVVSKVVTRSPAAKAGLQAQDLVLEVNRQPIASESDYREAVEKSGRDGIHLFRIMRNGQEQLLTIEVDLNV